jgi:hypothetical protein
MERNKIWMALVTDQNNIALCKLFQDLLLAQKAIVTYLQDNHNFEGDRIQDACTWICDNTLPIEVMTFEVDWQELDKVLPAKGLLIKPPSNGDHYYRVVYETECYSHDGVDAAQMAWKAVRAKDAPDPALTLIDSKGAVTKVDLANLHAFNKITPGFVTQRYRKGEDGMYHCCWQEFTAGDDVQYVRPNGERIDPPNYVYQEYNMMLESEGGILLCLRQALKALDVGGEPSRQFADQIRRLKSLIQTLTRV